MAAALQAMDVGVRSLGDHAPACGAQAIERIASAAAPLAGRRVLHVSAAGGGGSVPDLLGALLPLAADAGIAPEWRVLFGGPEVSHRRRPAARRPPGSGDRHLGRRLA